MRLVRETDTPSDTAYAGPVADSQGLGMLGGSQGRVLSAAAGRSEAAAGMWLRAWDGVGSPTLETEPQYRHLPHDQLTLTGRQPQGEPTPEMAADLF